MTVAAARRMLAQVLRDAGIETSELDARVLMQSQLALSHAAIAAASERRLTREMIERIGGAAARRLRREPVALIVGQKEFWGLQLRVTPATLVPRPDTETVVEAALRLTDARAGRLQPLRIADLGTGSGALLLALLSELPRAFGVATDTSLEALLVAAENARRLSLARRAAFVACDFGAALAGGFDLVVCNPPYVESAVIAALAPEVRDYEPIRALDGGADGLAAYRAIAAQARLLLAPSGHLVVELGFGQSHAVAGILEAAGLAAVFSHADLAGIPRAIVARRA
jgi:release factor glutamine methyltransferase